LLALERRHARIDEDLRTLKREDIQLWQELWDEWSKIRTRAMTAPTTDACAAAVSAFPDVHPCIPTAIPFLCSHIGFADLVWNGGSLTDTTGTWTGCMVASRPASTGCPARDMPVWFTMYINPLDSTEMKLKAEWISTGTCPESGKLCGSDYGLVNRQGIATLDTLADPDDTYASKWSLRFLAPGPLLPSGIASPPGQNTIVYLNQNIRGDWLPASFTLIDAMWGTGTMVFQKAVAATPERWNLCLPGLAYPGYLTCSAATFALHYLFEPLGPLILSWKGAVGLCPANSVCADAATVDDELSSDDPTYQPTTKVWSGTPSPGSPLETLYQGNDFEITFDV
jgi:hypothetical protein